MPSPTIPKPHCGACHGTGRALFISASLPCDECCSPPAPPCECCGERPACALDGDGIAVCDKCLSLTSDEAYAEAYARLVARHPDDSGLLSPWPIDAGPDATDEIDRELELLGAMARAS